MKEDQKIVIYQTPDGKTQIDVGQFGLGEIRVSVRLVASCLDIGGTAEHQRSCHHSH